MSNAFKKWGFEFSFLKEEMKCLKEYEDKIKKSITLVNQWISEGKTMKDIAEKIEIPYSTFMRYSSQNQELKDAVREGKEKRNQNVVAAVYKNCIGYHYYEEVPTKIKKETTTKEGDTVVEETVHISKVKKYKGPDLNAQKYWLNNREGGKWKDDPHKVANDKKLTKIKVDEAKIKSNILGNNL